MRWLLLELWILCLEKLTGKSIEGSDRVCELNFKDYNEVEPLGAQMAADGAGFPVD
jgi:hypothetical protein